MASLLCLQARFQARRLKSGLCTRSLSVPWRPVRLSSVCFQFAWPVAASFQTKAAASEASQSQDEGDFVSEGESPGHGAQQLNSVGLGREALLDPGLYVVPTPIGGTIWKTFLLQCIPSTKLQITHIHRRTRTHTHTHTHTHKHTSPLLPHTHTHTHTHTRTRTRTHSQKYTHTYTNRKSAGHYPQGPDSAPFQLTPPCRGHKVQP